MRLLLGVVAGASACGENRGHGSPSVDTAGVAVEVDSTMRDHFSAFERGDISTWSSILADDVFFTAADPADVFGDRASVREKMQRDIGQVTESGITLAIRPVSHLVWVADQGRTAGVTYDLDYGISYQDQRFSYRLRSAYLLERDSSRWKVLAAQYSRPVPYDTLFMALVRRAVTAGAGFAGQVPPAASDVVRQFRADIRDIQQASFAADAAIVTPGTLARGSEEGRLELVRWLGPAGNATERGDGLRAGLNTPGTVAWVATNLQVPVFAGPESAVAPMRALFVYRLTGDQWKIVQANLSVGLKER